MAEALCQRLGTSITPAQLERFRLWLMYEQEKLVDRAVTGGAYCPFDYEFNTSGLHPSPLVHGL